MPRAYRLSLGFLMEWVLTIAVALGTARAIADLSGGPVGDDDWRGVSLGLIAPVLVGIAAVQGPAVWWEALRSTGPSRWGRGRRIWSFAGLVIVASICSRAAIILGRCVKGGGGIEPGRLLAIHVHDLLARLPELLGPGVLFLVVAGRVAERRRGRAIADAREWLGRAPSASSC